MQSVACLRLLSLIILSTLITNCNFESQNKKAKVLVFSKTTGFRHESIEKGIETIESLGKKNHFSVYTTENADFFVEDSLKEFSAVIFLNTTGDILNHYQQAVFERFIQAGGGFVGIHAATDTEYHWPWYTKMVGGQFDGHPEIQEAIVNVEDNKHPASSFLKSRIWNRTDEWYNIKKFNPSVNVLLKLDESSYKGGTMNNDHPIAWYHEFDGGRAFYTGFGHTNESFDEPLLLKHLLGGIQYAIGKNQKLDYSKAKSQIPPDANRFTKTVLTQNLNEPMEIDLLPDGQILIIERRGDIKRLNPQSLEIETINHIDVFTEEEDGLLGLALDPTFEENNWVYLYYSNPGPESKQFVARFDYKDGKLDQSSEKRLLTVEVQRETCCHSAGGLEFGPNGNLYISTGDDTNPFESSGYAPIDERQGRKPWDAQRSSANTNDLRGKILRIKPEANGTYSIPEGNLFPVGTPNTRPEIYAMGCRNPFRFSIDSHTQFLYWGDVGPDAQNNRKNRGPRGHDEINQARKAGFFGWPYFNGDNKPYMNFNFATNTTGAIFNPAQPINQSVNNTGQKQLPPAQSAFIWYPYATSSEFPLVGAGGRNAMAGPIYYSEDYASYENKFPSYYNGKLIIYDWMRGWILIATMDKEGNFEKLEPFAPHLEWSSPTDMLFAPNGTLYVLEYGPVWYQSNKEARVSKVEYFSGNRPPVAEIVVDKSAGKTPLTVQFSSINCIDPDTDPLSYQWKFTDTDKIQSTEANPSFTFEDAGSYKVVLIVEDPSGQKATTDISVTAGNSIPKITWEFSSNNQSFYWDIPFAYEVKVNDEEDGSTDAGNIKPEAVFVNIDYLPGTEDRTIVAMGHQSSLNKSIGAQAIEKHNCITCHNLEVDAIGPAYQRVADHYKTSPTAMRHLVNIIQNGGQGKWTDRVMPANPQISKSEAQKIVEYILTLGEKKQDVQSLALKGIFELDAEKYFEEEAEEEEAFEEETVEAEEEDEEDIEEEAHEEMERPGIIVLSATYTDKGGAGIPGYTHTETIELRSPLLEAELCPNFSEDLIAEYSFDTADEFMVNCKHNSFFNYPNLDLTGVQNIQMQYAAFENESVSGVVEIRIDSKTGPQIGSIAIPTTSGEGIFQTSGIINPIIGFHDLFFIFKYPEDPDVEICLPDWFYLNNKRDQLGAY